MFFLTYRKHKDANNALLSLAAMAYYDEMNGNTYGGGGNGTLPIDMMMSNEQALKQNQLSYNTTGDEVDYSASRARVMSEIIV